MQEVIKVEQLIKSYNKLLAVSNVSISVSRGTVFGLLGANGAGKSTTIECILGTKKADSGQVSVLGMHPLALLCGKNNGYIRVSMSSNRGFYGHCRS